MISVIPITFAKNVAIFRPINTFHFSMVITNKDIDYLKKKKTMNNKLDVKLVIITNQRKINPCNVIHIRIVRREEHPFILLYD